MSILHYNYKDALKAHVQTNIQNGNDIDIDTIRLHSIQQIQDEDLRNSEKAYLENNKQDRSLLGYPNYKPSKRIGFGWNSKKGYGYWGSPSTSLSLSDYSLFVLLLILLFVIV